MKQLILLVLGCLLLTGFSTDRGGPNVAISIERMVVYKNQNYPFMLETEGIPDEELKVLGIECTVTKKDTGKYVMTPTPRYSAYKCGIEVYHENKKLQTFAFSISRYPEPRLTVGRIPNDNTFSPSVFKRQTELTLPITNFEAKIFCTTKSFIMTRIVKRGGTEVMYNEGGRFSEATLSSIKKASSGDIYIFDNIEYTYPNDRNVVKHWATKVIRIK